MKTLYQKIKLKELKGKETIARADIFSYIDSDFENWNTDKKGEKTAETEVAVCEMTKDATFAELFIKPEEMTLTQEQIIEFCKSHEDKLRNSGYGTFFLFKVGSEFFVASVDVNSDGHLDVDAARLSNDHVWHARYRDRVVIPQLALKHLDTMTLSPSDPLTLEKAIERVKQEGYVIYKPI